LYFRCRKPRNRKHFWKLYTRFDSSVKLQSLSPSRTRHNECKPRCSADARRAVSHTPSQRYNAQGSSDKPTNSSKRSAKTKAALKVYECEGIGHFAGECPTRLKREVNSMWSRPRSP
jgi:hypothetical protein